MLSMSRCRCSRASLGPDERACHRFSDIDRFLAGQQRCAAAVDEGLALRRRERLEALVRIDERQCGDPLGVKQCRSHRYAPAHGETDQMRPFDIEMIDHPQHVGNEVVERQRAA